MGGTSTQQQQQSSTTAPWAEAQPAIKGILDQLQPQIANSGLSAASSGAIDQLEQNAQGGNPFSGQINGFASNLLNGGGANGQAGAVQGGLDAYKTQMGQYADPNYSSLNDPRLRAALDQVQSDVGNSVNGQFAAAGRDMSGANQMAYGRGVSAGQTPLLLNQFNQDQTLKQNAANGIFNAQNTASGLLSGMNQQGLSNQLQGVTTASDANAARNYTPTQMLQFEQARQSIPAQNLGLLAQIGVPIAGLGGTSNSTSSGSNTMSGAQQFATIAQGIGSMMPKAPMSFSF